MLTPFGIPMPICLAYVFVLGAVVGSFLNVCIFRIPKKDGLWEALRGITTPKSRCPRCCNSIPPWFNLPVIGWLMLRGRCYYCKGWISPRYPLIEFGNGALWALVYWMEVPGHFGATISDSMAIGEYGPTGYLGSFWFSPTAVLHWRYFYHMVLIEALVVASFIDLDHWIIPDASTLPAMAVGLVGSIAIGELHMAPLWHQNMRVANDLMWRFPGMFDDLLLANTLPEWINQHPHLHGLACSVAGLIVGGGIVWIVRLIGHWTLKREAMGFGDVILMALIGSFLGWQASVMVFFLAPLLALGVVISTWVFQRRRELPFGPYLSLAALLVILFWQPLWARSEQIFGIGFPLVGMGLFMLVLFAIVMKLVHLVLSALGLASYDDPFAETEEEWTSGDHLFYYSSEHVDQHQGRWPNHNWPGTDSSRGWSHYQAWRHGR